MTLIINWVLMKLIVSGGTTGRVLLSNNEATDRQSEQAYCRTWLGIDVACHRIIWMLAVASARVISVSTNSPTPDFDRFVSEVAKNSKNRSTEASTSPGGSGSHTAQNDADIPQGLLP